MATTDQTTFAGSEAFSNWRQAPFAKRQGHVDWPLFATLLVAILLSGVVQYVGIFVLAGINVLLQALLLWRVRFRFSKKSFPAILIVSAYFIYCVVLYLTIDAGPPQYIAFRFHDIITALLILNYILVRRPDFLYTLGAVLVFLVVHGMINWLIVNLAFSMFRQDPGIKAYQFLIFFGMSEKYLGIHRSQGLFWEPGVYQIYLNFALHFFLFYARKQFLAGAALLGVILTLSTTGIVVAGLQLAYALLFSRASMIRKVLTVLVSLPLLLIYVDFASGIVADKVVGDRAGSFWSRSFDTRNGIAVAAENPFGIGFDPDVYQSIASANIFNIETNIMTDRGNTNGIVMLFYSTGLIWAVVFLIFTYRQKIVPEHRFLFFLVLALSMSSSPLTFSPFFFLFTLSGLVRADTLMISRQKQ